MSEEKFLSLYDYLKRAAGSELGKQVATRAAELNVGFKTRHVSNAKYTGEIMLYPESFLKWYFKTPDADEMRKNSEIDLDELLFLIKSVMGLIDQQNNTLLIYLI